MKRNYLPLFVVAVFLASLACSLFTSEEIVTPNPATTTQPLSADEATPTLSTASSGALPTPEYGAQTPVEGVKQATFDRLIDNTLALTSVLITLEVTSPAGGLNLVEAEIDSVGNQHILKTYPQGQMEELFAGVPIDMSNSIQTTELYLIDGIVYSPVENGKFLQADAPALKAQLASILKGAEGPGLWLKILPAGSLVLSGQEEKGGFQTRNYSVDGTLETETIWGEIWVDMQSEALVAADLNIPAGLTSTGADGSEDLSVRFMVERTGIAPLQIDPSMLSSEEETNPFDPVIPNSTGEEGLLGDIPIYPGAVVQSEMEDTVIYLVSAGEDAVSTFYQEGLTAAGWTQDGEPVHSGDMIFQSWLKDGAELMLTISPMDEESCMLVLLLTE